MKVKKLLMLMLALLVAVAVGCSKEDAKPKTKPIEKTVEAEEVLTFETEKDEDLKQIGKQLILKMDALTMAKTEEEYDKIRKEIFVDYETYAPMSDFASDKYTQVGTKVGEPKISKSESYFLYEVDYKVSKKLKDGQVENSEGHATLEIIQSKDGSYKVTVVR